MIISHGSPAEADGNMKTRDHQVSSSEEVVRKPEQREGSGLGVLANMVLHGHDAHPSTDAFYSAWKVGRL